MRKLGEQKNIEILSWLQQLFRLHSCLWPRWWMCPEFYPGLVKSVQEKGEGLQSGNEVERLMEKTKYGRWLVWGMSVIHLTLLPVDLNLKHVMSFFLLLWMKYGALYINLRICSYDKQQNLTTSSLNRENYWTSWRKGVRREKRGENDTFNREKKWKKSRFS